MRALMMAAALLAALAAWPADAGDRRPNLLETNRQAEQRRAAERYEQDRRSPYGQPLGGYRDRLGDTGGGVYGSERRGPYGGMREPDGSLGRGGYDPYGR